MAKQNSFKNPEIASEGAKEHDQNDTTSTSTFDISEILKKIRENTENNSQLSTEKDSEETRILAEIDELMSKSNDNDVEVFDSENDIQTSSAGGHYELHGRERVWVEDKADSPYEIRNDGKIVRKDDKEMEK